MTGGVVGGQGDGRAVRVFVSYAHESPAHEEAVRDLWVFLRANGIDAQLDRLAAQQRQDWSLWMADQVRDASAAYKRRAEGRAGPDEGRGVQYEARLIRDAFYRDQTTLDRYVPVVLPGGSTEDVPDFLTPATSTVYRVSTFTVAGAESLLRLLTGQPAEVEPPLGPVPVLVPREAGTAGVAGAAVLRHEVRVEVEPAEAGRVATRTFLAGTLLGEQRATLPRGLGYCWDGLDLPSAADRQVELGRGLWRALFDEATTRRLLELIDHSGWGTVVEVVVHLAPELAALPVELLRLPDGRLTAATAGVRVTRRLTGVDRPPTPALPGPLKVLAAVAAPEETATTNTPLDVEAEMQALLDAVTDIDIDGAAQVWILEVASLAEVGAALAADQYHVLHLSAHGSATGLELEDEDGNPEPATVDQLVAALRGGKKPLPLVVLSSCAGAAAGADGPAGTLIRRGADRVVAMQTAVTDTFATALAHVFYRTLARDPGCTVGEALAVARRTVADQQLAAVRRGGPVPRPELAVPTLVAAGTDPPVRDPQLPAAPLSRATQAPSGWGVRELPIGDLIGRRAPLRTTIAALRGTRADREKLGAWSGVVLSGVGGIGKTALAGRALSRMRADGWLVVEHIGAWSPPNLFGALATTLTGTTHAQLVDDLRNRGIDDTQRLGAVLELLRRERLLVLFDDFEQNLSPDGREFLDPGFGEIFGLIVDAAQTGRLLVTCRYPVPGADTLLRVELPALSPSELRRMMLRLPALRALPVEDRRLISRTIGGHPRLIEFLDVLLRDGTTATFQHITRKLRILAEAEHLDVSAPHHIEEAVARTVLLGSRDIVLDVLFEGLTPDQHELLMQAAVCNVGFTPEDLAYARHGDDSTPQQRRSVSHALERLRDLTLVSPTPHDELLVHPWIAAALHERHTDDDLEQCHRRGAAMRLHRLTTGRGGFDDLVELIRHHTGCHEYDNAVEIAFQACDLLDGEVAISALLAEVVPLIPTEHPGFLALADRECEALQSIGLFNATTERRHMLLAIAESRAAADPGNAGYQRDLSISHDNLGNLAVAAGDSTTAEQHYRTGLTIAERLAAADPGNAEYQRDLSISHNKLRQVTKLGEDTTS
ncbi:MAG: CHAT domain-containing protein [Pseudonocardia sp.]